MKNTIISILIFILMMIGIFFSINYINSMSTNLISICEKLEIDVNNNNWVNAYTTSIKLLEKWDKHSNIISLYVNSTELDTMNNEIIKLTQYIECETKDESLVTIHLIKYLIKDIASMQKLNLQNVF